MPLCTQRNYQEKKDRKQERGKEETINKTEKTENSGTERKIGKKDGETM
jgi:hypothetical protein